MHYDVIFKFYSWLILEIIICWRVSRCKYCDTVSYFAYSGLPNKQNCMLINLWTFVPSCKPLFGSTPSAFSSGSGSASLDKQNPKNEHFCSFLCITQGLLKIWMGGCSSRSSIPCPALPILLYSDISKI